jgi:3-hydroxyacyl-[acyl-carrier-protein] dehydratase
MANKQVINVDTIMKMIPHRYPMLMVDKIVEVHEEKGIVGLKNVTINEEFFLGHFPSHPVMPGVLIIEAMAQTAGIYVIHNTPNIDPEKTVVYFMSIDEAQFRKPVVPGDSLYLHVEKVKSRGNVWKMKGEARVEGQRVANAVFTAMIVDKNKAG